MGIDWAQYAREYDLMVAINPAYRAIVDHCVATVRGWNLEPGSTIADLGAGTGNFSVALGQALPHVRVLHVDSSHEMTACAERKATLVGLANWSTAECDLDSDWSLPGIAGAITVHAAYTLKDPRALFRRVAQSLSPGGMLYAVDVGRPIGVLDWALYLFANSLKQRGIVGTLKLLPHTSILARENRRGAALMRAGTYWSHTLDQFAAVVTEAGFEIVEQSGDVYRGYSDRVVARRSGTRVEP